MDAPILYMYDENGVYIYSDWANPSPLEEGVWLYPARSTDVEPPEIPSGKCAVWNGNRWDICDLPELPQPSDELTVDEVAFVRGLIDGTGGIQ